MRTTVDIPDDLLRRAKATAALRGLKLKDLIADLLEQGLTSQPQEARALGQKRAVPVTIPPAGRTITPFTNAELEETFLQEDLERIGLNRPA